MCTTSRGFNQLEQLSSRGAKVVYDWVAMGSCSGFDFAHESIQFQVMTSGGQGQVWFNELSLCHVRLNVSPWILTWIGKTKTEGRSPWYNFTRSRNHGHSE